MKLMEIPWESDFEAALKQAQQQRKPLLLQFEREGCVGCQKLYATTYRDEKVVEEIQRWFIPVQQNLRQHRTVRARYSAVWTPSFYFIDYLGKVHWAVSGYLNGEDFRLTLRLGLAHNLIPRGKYTEALEVLHEGISMYPENPLNATLLYWKILTEYLINWDQDAMRKSFLELQQRYPHSLEARMFPWEDEYSKNK